MKDVIYLVTKPRLIAIADIITGIIFHDTYLIFSLSYSL